MTEPLYERYALEPLRAQDVTPCPICHALTYPDQADTHQAWHRTLTNLPQEHR